MIAAREDFETYGALRAGWTSRKGAYVYTGYLRGYDAEVFDKHKWQIEYVVWSYSTPIAWWSEMYGWHLVRQTFSVTTSRHQGRLYLIDGNRFGPWFDTSVGEDLACRYQRGQHIGPVGYTDDGTMCERHYLMRPKVARDPLARLALTNLMAGVR
jgi:hypothetical protein